jgi:tetratricopeptide (TPR) repeat protein
MQINRKGIIALLKYIKKIFIILTCLFFSGCAVKQPQKIFPSGESTLESSQTSVMEEDMMLAPEPEETFPTPSPRDLANQNLVNQAKAFLDENKPDESIRSLEQAIHISPRGENYYYLAEAWYMKGNLSQAREYNSLAAIYFKDDADWMERVEEQRDRIGSSR